MLSPNQLEILIKARDEASRVIKNTRDALRKLGSSASKVARGMRSAFSTITGSIFNLKTSVVGLAGAFGFGMLFKSVLQTGGAFEDYAATLKTVLGSQEAANKSLAWLQKFAETTPFELDQLTQSFVRLAAYGIKGEDVLGTLGDTAAAMGKDIMQAVEALADAQTGEFERLKEFGVKAMQITKSNAKKFGASLEQVGQTALAYTDKNGKEMYKIVDRNNRAIITSTLMSIFNDRYAGAMQERSKTMNGMLSNLADAWTSWQNKVAGRVLPLMKAALDRVLEAIDQFNKDGTLDRWATSTSNAMNAVIAFTYGALQGLVGFFKEFGSEANLSQKDIDSYRESGKNMAETIGTKVAEMKLAVMEAFTAIRDPLSSTVNFFKNIKFAVDEVVRAFERYQKVAYNIGQLLASPAGSRQSGSALYNVMNPDAETITGTRASGGGVQAGKSYMVGERGAEMFTPTTSGTISPSGSQGTTVINNIYTSNSRHGVDNALSSRGNMTIRSSRVGLNLAAV